jgi:hypothetical protein
MTMNTIKYFIFQTKLHDDIKHVGRILLNRCYDTPMLVDRMLNMGTSMTRTDIEAVLTLLVSAVRRFAGKATRSTCRTLSI